MDRDRLKEVHQTDLTESRVNEDFVDWLKNKGPTWLLVVLIALCAYLAVVRYRQHKTDLSAEAWAALGAAELPGSYEDVAEEFGKVGQVANVAWLQAADELLRSVQRATPLGATATAPPTDPTSTTPPEPEVLIDEDRTQYLTRAEGLYEKVLTRDDGSLGTTLFTVNALNGLAAVAESRGDADAARGYYDQAATRAESFFPGLADQARARAESSVKATTIITLLSRQEVGRVNGAAAKRDPVEIEDALRDFLLPEESDG